MVPPKLKQALELFKSLPKELRSQVLLEYAAKVPPPPPGVELERVHECQTPFFVHADVEGGKVRLYFHVPDEAPTVKAFAEADPYVREGLVREWQVRPGTVVIGA